MGLAVVDLYPGPRAVIVAALGAVHRTPQDQLKFVLGAVKRFQPRGYPIALVVESIAAGSWIEAELEMCALRSADDVLFKSVSPTSLPTWWRVKRLAHMMEDGLVHLVAGGEGIDRLVNQARAYPTTQKAGDDLLSAASLVAIPTLTRAPRRASYHGTTLTPYRRP
jgi:hypothetical protein